MTKVRNFLSKHKLSATKILLIAFFICVVIIPLIRMLVNIDGESITSVFTSPSIGEIVGNSLLSTTISTLITLVLAYMLAYSIERSNIKLKGAFSIILVLPMLIPAISHGMGLVVMFGNNGLFTQLFNGSSKIYGLTGIVIGSVMYAFPVAFLMFQDVLKYQDCTPYQAAQVLGIPARRQFTGITLPYLRKPLISITLAVFTLIITDYGVPLMVGGKFKTIPTTLYQEAVGMLNFKTGSVYGVFLLIPAIIGFAFDSLNKDKGNSSYNTTALEIKKNTLRDTLCYALVIAVSVFVLMPICVYVIMAFSVKYPTNISFTFDNFSKAFQYRTGRYIINSVSVALFVAVIGVGIAFVTAYLTARVKSKASKALHLFAITSAAIPGLVLGLSYVLVFKGSFIYGTIIILIMVNIIHFISSPYLMMYNSLSKLNENLEDVGSTLGISKTRIIWNVIIPQNRSTLLEMFAYFFVNSMMTISAVSFIANADNRPLALMINQFQEQMQLEIVAVISLMILFINLAIKGVAHLLKSKISKRSKASKQAEAVK